ncbi:MAG: 3-ketoacyl-ACP reductase [Patescibacteria group bacterium]|nr:3-ketoacyl-ACP reductase [Patescibacteria group bacterium]
MKRVALITGGSRGIGYGISRCLAREDFDLAICGVRPEQEVTESLNYLRSLGSEVLYCQADISNGEMRSKLLHDIQEHYGRLHVLVNNAGVAPEERRDILEASEDSFERIIRINLQGPFFLTQAAANWLIEQKGKTPDFSGCIINISSVSATVASTNRGDYCISKAGIGMATKLWAVRLAEFDIPVYEVRPGIIKTDMTIPVEDKYDKLIDEGLLLQSRWGLSEDVGKAVAMLARNDLPYSTGQVIMVDGGLTVQRL